MLLEQSIANYLSLQPYEYINTEIAEDGKQRLLHLKSTKETEDVQCPFCNGHVHILQWACAHLWQLQHETQGHACVPGDKAGCGGKLPPLPLPEMLEDFL